MLKRDELNNARSSIIADKKGAVQSNFNKLILKKNFLKVSGLLLLIALILALIFFKKIPLNLFSGENPVCGDGTFSGGCSANAPYYCDKGVLIEQASVCGCPQILNQSSELCISKYQTNPKNVTLKYILRGEKNEFNLTIYEGLMNYISNLSISIYYNESQTPSRADFKLRNINNPEQRELLLPLLVKIQNLAEDKTDQMRIAASIVQNIEFGNSKKNATVFGKYKVDYSRYPYEVLYDSQGICGEKSELLAFLLREMNYSVVFFYNKDENHESLGVRCPMDRGWRDTGYCFFETTGPSIITDSEIAYAGGITLKSDPQLLLISDGGQLPEDLYEYKDAKVWQEIRKSIIDSNGRMNPVEFLRRKWLIRKYGIGGEYNL